MTANQRLMKGRYVSEAARREQEWEKLPKTRKQVSEVVAGDVVWNGSKSDGQWLTVVSVAPGAIGSGGVMVTWDTDAGERGTAWVMLDGEPFYVRGA